jgi:hypothetical protein
MELKISSDKSLGIQYPKKEVLFKHIFYYNFLRAQFANVVIGLIMWLFVHSFIYHVVIQHTTASIN